MAVYEIKYSTNDVFLKERHIYGADRLGMVQLKKLVYNHGIALPTDNYSTNTLGNKRYELTNHLGNVNAIITDRKVLNSEYSALSHYFDFASTGHTGWTTTGCSGTTIALASGRLRFTSGSSCAFDAYKSFQVSPGRPYTISFDLDRTDIANMNVLIYTASGPSFTGASLITTITNPASGAISYSFTPTQQYVFVYFKKLSTENKTFYIDNLKIQTVATSPYAAVTVMTSDYYPFGMQMPRRHTDDPSYRFGYNGMEKDPEAKGEGNSYTTEFRQYDPRLGRWLSLDPLKAKYPWMSPYVAFNDNPIFFTDPLGLEGKGTGKRSDFDPDGGAGNGDRTNGMGNADFCSTCGGSGGKGGGLSNFLQKLENVIQAPQRVYTKVSREQHDKWMSQGRVGHYNENSNRSVQRNQSGQYFLDNGRNKERLGTGDDHWNYGAPLMYQIEGEETVESGGQTHQQVFLLEPIRMKKKLPTDNGCKSGDPVVVSARRAQVRADELAEQINQDIDDLVRQGYKKDDIEVKFSFGHNLMASSFNDEEVAATLTKYYGSFIAPFLRLNFGIKQTGGQFIFMDSTGVWGTLLISYEIIVTETVEEYSYD